MAGDENFIDRLYEILVDPSAQPRFFEELRTAVNADCILLTEFAHGTPSRTVWCAGEFDADIVRLCETVHASNPISELLWETKEEGWINIEDHLPLSAIQDSAFYNDVLRRQNFDHSVGAILSRGASSILAIGLGRGRHAGAFGEAEVARLTPLLPHLRRVVRLRDLTASFQGIADGTHAALHALDIGLVILDRNGSPLWTNKAFDEIAAGGSVRAGKEGVLAANSRDQIRLREMIAPLLEGQPSEPISLVAPDADAPAVVAGIALQRGLATRIANGGMREPAAILFVTTALRSFSAAAGVFAQVFGLTPAESRLLNSLADGNNLRDAALNLGIAHTTAKSHLSSIFGKTGTSRQSQLMSLFARLPPVRGFEPRSAKSSGRP